MNPLILDAVIRFLVLVSFGSLVSVDIVLVFRFYDFTGTVCGLMKWMLFPSADLGFCILILVMVVSVEGSLLG